MRVLEVSRYKSGFIDHISPFVKEQGEALRSEGVEVDYFLIRGSYMLAIGDLKKKIKQFQPDVIHAHYGLSAITALLQRSVPVVTTFHNGEWHKWWVNILTSTFTLRANHVIYVAPHVREKMFVKHKHYTILPCGVNMNQIAPMDYDDVREILQYSTDKYYILFGGAFNNTRKGYSLLACALNYLAAIGGRNIVQNIECVEMKGMSRLSVVQHLSACDLFVLPTQNEGSPQALKEAMACNCPIIATDVADIAHLLGDVAGHFLLTNKNTDKAVWKGSEHTLDEFAKMIQASLSLPRGFRTEGRKRIEDLGYTNQHVARKLIEIYQKVIK